MAKVAAAMRTHPLAGRKVAKKAVKIGPAEPAARLSLRAGEEAIASLSRALGVKLPTTPKSSAANKSGSRVALWLGPDEWLVIDTGGGDPVADCARAKAPHSAVDVSHRNTGILVEGAGAEDVLSAGCPQDLSLAAYPVGACSRTVLGKIEAVLLRTGDEAFRVECWRSFSTYAFDLLEEAARSEA